MSSNVPHTLTIKRVKGLKPEYFNDMSIDILEIDYGEYVSPPTLELSNLNRASRPLIVRPAFRAHVIFNAQNQAGINCAFLLRNVNYVTFVGSNGPDSFWKFTRYKLTSSGIFWMGGSHNLHFLSLSFEGNSGDAAGSNSHTFYVSHIESQGQTLCCQDVSIEHCRIDGGNRTITGSQCSGDVNARHPGKAHERLKFSRNVVTNARRGCVWNAVGAKEMRIEFNDFIGCDKAVAVEGGQGIVHGNASKGSINPAEIDGSYVDSQNTWDKGAT